MECLLDSGYVDSLGVCDLNKSTLEKLYEWARVRSLVIVTLQMTSDILIFLMACTCIVLPICTDKFIDDCTLSL